MALRFDAAADRVEFGSPAALRTADPYTLMLWVYQIAVVNGGVWVGQSINPNNTLHRFRTSSTTGNLQVFHDRVTTDSSYITNDTPMGSGRNNLWTFLAHTYNGAGAAGEVVNIYLGTLSSVAAERTYGTATDGAGARANNASGIVKVGNGAGDAVAPNGRIGVVGMVNRELTLQEIISWQFNPRVVANMLWYLQLGFNGTGQQFDWSGQGFHSTSLTGVTVEDHAPLRAPFAIDLGYMGNAGAGVPPPPTDPYPAGYKPVIEHNPLLRM